MSLISATILKKSGFSVCQKCLRNSAGNPSGPGALLLGMCVRALCSSESVNGASKISADHLEMSE